MDDAELLVVADLSCPIESDMTSGGTEDAALCPRGWRHAADDVVLVRRCGFGIAVDDRLHDGGRFHEFGPFSF